MPQQRLISLDVLRGLTVMLMIFVNNGAGTQIFSQLRHSRWNGMTLCDLVFPFFLFMVGISTYLSLRKTNFAWSAKTLRKIARRTALLFLIGLAINWFDMACNGNPLDLAHLRIMGVMQRIALCYGATAFVAILSSKVPQRPHLIPWIIAALLIAYSLLLIIGGGYDYSSATNLLANVDTHILGYDHLYHHSPVDPEGLLSTLPTIAHTLIGFWVARLALGKQGSHPTQNTVRTFLLAGAMLVVSGIILTLLLPLNKRIWSPSYVLTTCGLASFTQGLLAYLIEDTRHSVSFLNKDKGRGWTFFLIFGSNPLFLYVASEVLAISLGAAGIKDAVFAGLQALITNGYWASAAYATLFVLLHAAIGYPLWKRHIYIKI